MKLKAKHGYWATDHYPIGGSFRRAENDGKPIAEVIRTYPRSRGSHGTDCEVLFADGTRGALNSAHIEGEPAMEGQGQ